MSNPERHPPEIVESAQQSTPSAAAPAGVLVLAPRDVPLGGPRAMTVRRTLPHRDRSFVGAWCFVDHYGPDDVSVTGGMDVPPHPHTGLQTVSWLIEGEIEHRDSLGMHEIVRPGEVNLMTAGAGIAHSEVSTPATATLYGVQLWLVLPEADRGIPRDFQHAQIPSVRLAPGVTGRVFLGSLAGQRSPVRTPQQVVAVELRIAAGTAWEATVERGHEHGLLVLEGSATLNGELVERAHLGIVDAGGERVRITADSSGDVLALLLGGTPYDEEIVMWWNFIARDHDEIVALREQWQAGSDRFGTVAGYQGEVQHLPAPTLPGGHLSPRGRLGRGAR